jgi:hypothetical protein
MPRNIYGSIEYACACGTTIVFRRDDFLPRSPWTCEACLLAQLDQFMEESATVEELRREFLGDDRPIERVNFAAEWPRKVDFN